MPGVGFEPTRPPARTIGFKPTRVCHSATRAGGAKSATLPMLRCPEPWDPPPGSPVEASALQQGARVPALAGRSPLLRLQSDERLIALIRRGQHAAFEALVQRYQPRLLAFCRHMLGSQEDAEDVLQEVFAAVLQRDLRRRAPDQRAPVALPDRPQPLPQPPPPAPARRPGLDGHLRAGRRHHDRRHRPQARGVPPHRLRRPGSARDPAHGAAAARDRRALLRPDRRGDGHHRAERQVAPRARARLARRGRRGAPAHLRRGPPRARPGRRGPRQPPRPVRRHLRTCDRCRTFKVELRKTNRALAAIYPIGAAPFLKKLSLAKLGFGGAAARRGALVRWRRAAAAGFAGTAAPGRRLHGRRRDLRRRRHDRHQGGRGRRRRGDRHRRRRRGEARHHRFAPTPTAARSPPRRTSRRRPRPRPVAHRTPAPKPKPQRRGRRGRPSRAEQATVPRPPPPPRPSSPPKPADQRPAPAQEDGSTVTLPQDTYTAPATRARATLRPDPARRGHRAQPRRSSPARGASRRHERSPPPPAPPRG